MQRCEKKINRCTASKELPLDERINLLWVPAWVIATTDGHHHPSWRPNTAWLILWSLPSLCYCPAHKTNPLLAIETDEGRPFAAAARHSGRPLPLCKQRVVDHPCLGCQGHLLFSTNPPNRSSHLSVNFSALPSSRPPTVWISLTIGPCQPDNLDYDILSSLDLNILLLFPMHNVYFVQYDVTVTFLAQVLDTVTYFVSQVLLVDTVTYKWHI